MSKLERTIQAIEPLNEVAMHEAQQRLDNLTKPPGSLGVLEDVVKKIAGIIGKAALPQSMEKVIILMAGDHGVVAEGVSAFPQEVTPQMILNFANGGAAINVLAKHAGARLYMVDVGVAVDLPDLPGLDKRKIAYGTKNMAQGPAMTMEEAIAALEVGIDVVNALIDKGASFVAMGEMGIGNTTPSAALLSVLEGLPIEEAVGRGTGVNDEGLRRKITAINKALDVNRPNSEQPLDALVKVGGLEIAGLAGVVLGAAARRVPVMVDGFISGAAALVAVKMAPLAKHYLIGSHLSVEPGHRKMLDAMELKPTLMMDMRLGEGTGAALGMLMVDAAVKILNEMATFDDAGVSRE
ncbi:nicotinate-nucleotide--dimethylbenzimidazole phosphoribosyltransferase [Metallumcola ferriviriculae]|uniref:Nicotinate-nucleotide--dimethylbenzimidazole phosphoribosyltransferase n=1 Tax=Metallumcola ferriviriculae TaxID=3039180 RepID=A0AAU0UPN1_9FIRM|nr:nicotinate-nucleotide--dimethylbenzimidazole phosphoribosyltransferase [Desulfitibacteraceae bacterium MK1]